MMLEGEQTKNKDFSGKIVIQASPELHRRMALNAARRHLELNGYIRKSWIGRGDKGI